MPNSRALGLSAEMKSKCFLPPVYLFASIIIMALLHLLVPLEKLIAYPYNLIGSVPLALGIILNLVADAVFKKHGTTVKPFEESTTLVKDGVFRISRQPMHFGIPVVS